MFVRTNTLNEHSATMSGVMVLLEVDELEHLLATL